MEKNYLLPKMEVLDLSSEGVLCASAQTVAFTNEGYTSEETTFEW